MHYCPLSYYWEAKDSSCPYLVSRFAPSLAVPPPLLEYEFAATMVFHVRSLARYSLAHSISVEEGMYYPPVVPSFSPAQR